jgi:hypothetical protein
MEKPFLFLREKKFSRYVPVTIKGLSYTLLAIKAPSQPSNYLYGLFNSNGNASETKANKSFDNGVFFNNEGNTFESKQIIFKKKRTH